MARKPKTKDADPEASAPEDKEDAAKLEAGAARDDELCKDEKIVEKVRDLIAEVSKGFQSQWERGNDQIDYWDVYDCELGGRQAYAGNSQIFLPIVHKAVNARCTRFVNQIFPRSGRNVECITSDEKPYDIMALLEHYIRKTKLRTQIMPALMRNGDVEGQYNLYVTWENSSRHIAYRSKPTMEIEGEQIEEPDAEDEDITEEETVHMCPSVEVLADADVLILPHTANSIGDALSKGGSVTVIRRWTKARVEQAIDEDEIDEDEGEDLLLEFAETKDAPGQPEVNKQHVDAAGITLSGGNKQLTLYETWTRLKIKDERRLCRIYYAGGDKERVLSVKRNPYWNDKCPVLSAPVSKISNVFKGQSQIKPVADLQYAANDTVNEAMDSAAYALMPIVMTDPAKNPRVGSMVLNLAAIWETNPNDTKFAQFPALWKDGLTIVAALKNEIFQELSISPAAISQSTGGKAKRNQAEIAAEQQADILSTADVCTNLEDEILTPLLRWFVELDYQYRDKPLTVRQYGQMGVRAQMQDLPPIQVDRRFEFRWFGVEAARNAQMMQMQVSTMNVLRGIPPEQYQGYELNAVPIISALIENTFGPRLAPEIFKDIKSKLSLDPETENDFLMEGLTLPVHALDEDQEHMKVHLQAMKSGDPTGSVREHMMMHRFQMEKKMQAQLQGMAGMQRGGQPGAPGGGGQPGMAGSPRPGAQPAPPRGGQNPPGAIHHDRMQDASAAPRR
jgi:hypothetical protein